MVTVNVHSSYTVIPSDATPTGIFPLSLCDQRKLPSYGSLLFVYKPIFTDATYASDSHMSVLHTLRSSLSRALTYYYPLAARLCRVDGVLWGLHCYAQAQGAKLFEANCEDNLDDLGDFASTHVEEQLVPRIDYNCSFQDMPLLAAQLTKFRCGGLIVGVTLCRAINDGWALGSFMSSWAKLARGEKLDPNEMPIFDRTLLDSRRLKTEPRFVHSEFHPPTVWAGRLVDTKYEAKAATFKLSKEQVQKLKGKVQNFGTQQKPFTSFEVITGHLWRCVTKARYVGNGEQLTRLLTLVNCRNRLNPPLPSEYFGNVIFPTVTPTCSFDDITQKPLGYAVRSVKEAVERIKDEYVRSALDYIANQKDMTLMRNTFNVSSVTPEGEFKGNPNLCVVSWTNFPFYGTEFGWGKPAYVGPGLLTFDGDGKAFVMSNCDGDGFVVAICLQSSHLDALKNLFYEDIEQESLSTSKL